MSFGHAASRRRSGRHLNDTAPCPCGSGDSFGGCCGPLLRGGEAPTAERLMRSRYTAFFVGDAAYLEQSWQPRTRPDRIEIDGSLRWTGLQIIDVEAGGVRDTTGAVEFRASWTEGSGTAETHGTLHERSRFVRRAGRWWYLDGDVGDDPRP